MERCTAPVGEVRMSLIRFTAFAAAPEGVFRPGDVADIEEYLAAAWVRAGIAERVGAAGRDEAPATDDATAGPAPPARQRRRNR
jgi:hypothetical protein